MRWDLENIKVEEWGRGRRDGKHVESGEASWVASRLVSRGLRNWRMGRREKRERVNTGAGKVKRKTGRDGGNWGVCGCLASPLELVIFSDKQE